MGPQQSRVESIICTITGCVDSWGPRRSEILITCGTKETGDLVSKIWFVVGFVFIGGRLDAWGCEEVRGLVGGRIKGRDSLI